MKTLKPADKRDDTVLPDETAPKSQRFVDHNTIIYFAGKLAESSAAKRAASKAHDMVRKQFKNTGVSLGVFDTVSGLAELDDPNAIENFLDEFLHIAKAFNAVPVGTQTDFFKGPGSAEDGLAKAKKNGEILGLMGKNPDDQRYPPETDLGQAHMAGWHAGQEQRQKEFLAHNEAMRQEEAKKKADADEKAKRKAAKEAKAAEKAGRSVPKTGDGETVQ